MSFKGIITRPSAYSVKETIDKLLALIKLNGATLYARIDQQAELKNAGLNIPPLEFILFCKPVAGGKLIVENPVVALDLPLKIIAWEDAQQNVWVAYNDAAYIQQRFELTPEGNSPLVLDNMVTKALNIPV
jgi:uncharacterized protein (DUF302 family)